MGGALCAHHASARCVHACILHSGCRSCVHVHGCAHHEWSVRIGSCLNGLHCVCAYVPQIFAPKAMKRKVSSTTSLGNEPDVSDEYTAFLVDRARAIASHWEAGVVGRVNPDRSLFRASGSMLHSISPPVMAVPAEGVQVREDVAPSGGLEAPNGGASQPGVVAAIEEDSEEEPFAAAELPSRRAVPVPTGTLVADLAGGHESMWFDAMAASLSSPESDLTGAPLTCLDLFAGSGSVSAAFGRSGSAVASYDISTDGRCDITSKRGFYMALSLVKRLHSEALVMAGPPCALWTFLSSSVHKRNKDNPEGDLHNEGVRMSNLIVRNLVALLRVCVARGVYWVLEQPATSRMWDYPPMAKLLEETMAVRVFTYMGCFSHRMVKPTVLYGTLPSLGRLQRRKDQVPDGIRGHDRDPDIVGYSRDAEGRVSGNLNLHASATYTPQFASAILEAWELRASPVGMGRFRAHGRGRGRGSNHAVAAERVLHICPE